MPDRIITAEALITAKDGTGDVFERIAKKLQGVGKSAKVSAEIEKMNAALTQQRSHLAALDKMQAARSKFADARAKFNAQKVAVESAAKAMAAAEKPARELEAAYKRAQAAVSRASAEFEKQKTVMLNAKQAAESFGSPLAKIASDQVRLRGAIESTTSAIERQAGAERRAAKMHEAAALAVHRLKHAVREVSPLVMGGAGYETLEVTKDATKAGAEIQSERARMSVAGIPADEIARADVQAAHLAARYPNVTHAQILENYKDVRSVLLDKKETPEMMPTLIEARSAMTALDPSGKSADGLQYAIKGAELLGKAKNPTLFRDYLDGFIRAQQVMGSTIKPEQIADFAKYTRSAGPLLSPRFMHSTVNSLMQEEKGSTAGKMVADVVKEMTGGFEGSHAAAKELVNLGLAKEGDFNHTKTGELKGFKPNRHVLDWKKWQSDPDRAVWEDLVPAMEKKGMDLQTQIATVRRLFPNSLAADFVAKLITQRQSFENHSKLYGQATGIDGGDKLGSTDPLAAFGSLSKSLENLGATLTSPLMEKAAGVMDSLAHSIGSFAAAVSDWQKNSPGAAQAAAGGTIAGGLAAGGALGYGAIKGARSILGGAGSGEAAGGAATVGEIAGGLDAAATAAAVAEGGAIAGAVAAALPAAVAAALAGVVAHYGFGTFNSDKFKDTPENRDATQNIGALPGVDDGGDAQVPIYGPTRPKLPSSKSGWWDWIKESIIGSAHAETEPHPPASPFGGLGGVKAALGLQGPTPSFAGIPHPAFVPPRSTGASAVGGPITAVVNQPIDVTGKVEAEVKGQASVSVSIKVDGGEVTKQIASSSGNIKVSTGTSMPGSAKASSGSAALK